MFKSHHDSQDAESVLKSLLYNTKHLSDMYVSWFYQTGFGVVFSQRGISVSVSYLMHRQFTHSWITKFLIGGFIVPLIGCCCRLIMYTQTTQRWTYLQVTFDYWNLHIFWKRWRNIYVIHKARALQRKFGLVYIKLQCKYTIFTKTLQFMAHEIYVSYKQINIHVSYPQKNLWIKLFPLGWLLFIHVLCALQIVLFF